MRDAIDDLLRQTTLLTIAAAIALGYAVLGLANGVGSLVLSVFVEQGDFGSSGLLALDLGDRSLDFTQLVLGVVTLAVVLALILYVVRPDQRRPEDAEGLDTD